MTIVFKGVWISDRSILKAIDTFDSQHADTNDYKAWLENRTYKYALQHSGKLYPPKIVLSMAAGIATSEFSGGNQTNSVFAKLGFCIIKKP